MTSDTPAGRRLRVFRRRRSAPSRARRRLGAAARLLAALALAGGVYTSFAPGAFAEDNRQLTEAAQKGKALFDNSCITCHGRNAEGVVGRGPSLIGVGSASVEFQVGTGRMPMARQDAQAEQKPPQFDKAQTKQLGQYIQELGGGPQLPTGELTENLDTHPEALARGGELFRINCTSCHGFGGGGGALSSGKYAPTLDGCAERGQDVGTGHVVVEGDDGGDGLRGGDLTGGGAAHAVGDGEQARTGVTGILVALPDHALVRSGGETQ